jgi:hypothetical protein
MHSAVLLARPDVLMHSVALACGILAVVGPGIVGPDAEPPDRQTGGRRALFG